MEKSLFNSTSNTCSLKPENIKIVDNKDSWSCHFRATSNHGMCVETCGDFGLPLEAAKQYFKRNKRYMCVHLKTPKASPAQITITCHGFFSEKLVQDHPESISLRLRLVLGLILNSKSGGTVQDSCIISQEMETSPLETKRSENHAKEFEACIGNEPFIEKTFDIKNNRLFNILSKTEEYSLNANYKFVFFSVEQGARHSNICDKIKDRSIHSDFTIVAANDTELPCHKHFLAVHSSVLATAITTDMAESKTSKIKIDDMSEEGVTAFLDYIYERDVKRPWGNCQIALELHQAGHKYNIEQLETKMQKTLLCKPNEWFSAEVGLRLFLFARNLDSSEDLKRKAVEVVQSKSKEILESKACLDIFNGNKDALDFITYLLEEMERIGNAQSQKAVEEQLLKETRPQQKCLTDDKLEKDEVEVTDAVANPCEAEVQNQTE